MTPTALTRRAALLGAGCLTLALPASAEATHHLQALFVIARSKNKNALHYHARVDKSGNLDPNQPVSAHWLMLAEDGRREGLTFLERRLAYGWSTSLDATGTLSLRLRAFPARVLRVVRGERGRFEARLNIARQPARLERLFVATDESALTPSVRYVDIEGFALSDARRLIERVTP
ncbi:MAG: DUF4833 domain-containing protein [Polyangiaceae bacterium]